MGKSDLDTLKILEDLIRRVVREELDRAPVKLSGKVWGEGQPIYPKREYEGQFPDGYWVVDVPSGPADWTYVDSVFRGRPSV